MQGRDVRRPGRTISLLLSLLLAVSCTGDGDGGGDRGQHPADEPSRSAPTQARPVPMSARIGAVAGRLPHERRRPVLDEISAVVDRWFEAAYLGGAYPRSRFGNAFPGFTRGAARLARADRRDLSNWGIRSRVDEVTARRKVVRVDVLSPKGYARAATARFRLDFVTEGKLSRRFTVKGRLMLTKDRRGSWKVFGYDVRRTVRPGGKR